ISKEVKEAIVEAHAIKIGKQKVNDELEICIDGNRGTGLSTSEKFLYFEFNYKEGKIKHRCERYRLTEHPRFENFFLVGDIGKKNAESLLEICATCSISGRYGRPRPR
ncbi:12029_t:CDS:2, partial [Racocetra persica]